MLTSRSSVALSLVSILVACQPRAVQDPRSAESEIRARSHALVVAEGKKDVETAMTYWADDAVIQTEGMTSIKGRASVRGLYQEFFKAPMVAFEATITDLYVARSGELAYETGNNFFTMEQGGQRVRSTGKYLAIWRRQADGRWLISTLSVTNDKPPGQ